MTLIIMNHIEILFSINVTTITVLLASLSFLIHPTKSIVVQTQEILWKFCEKKVSAEFWANRLKPCRNSAFPKKFHKRKLDEITAFYAVNDSCINHKKKQAIAGLCVNRINNNSIVNYKKINFYKF